MLDLLDYIIVLKVSGSLLNVVVTVTKLIFPLFSNMYEYRN